MAISSAIPQLRTTNLAESVRFYTTTKDPSIEFVDHGEHFHLYLETDDAAAGDQSVSVRKKTR